MITSRNAALLRHFGGRPNPHEPCEACEGTGTVQDEIDCPCKGCVRGEHAIELPCGSATDVPCMECNGRGKVKSDSICSSCGGEGLVHEWGPTRTGRLTLDGEPVPPYHYCKVCGERRWA